jgi:hypothetical protein
MAYDTHDVRFLFSCLHRGASFKRVLVIGRSLVWVTSSELCDAAAEFGINMDLSAAERILTKNSGYCEPFFEFLGAEEIKAMDVSNYEGAQLIHDLNQPLQASMNERFTAVVDGGSLEHVFNIVQAFKNCMELTAEGGNFLALSPANNLSGHGFHQLSPEFLFAALSEQNGFKIRRMLMHENMKKAPVYEVMDPREYGQRVMLCNKLPVFIKTWATRQRVKPLFETFPQQPDWDLFWQKKADARQERSLKQKVRDMVRQVSPRLLCEYQRIRIERSQETGFKPRCYKKTTY